MNGLADLQARFQNAVMAGDDAVLDELVDTSKENRGTLLGVYRNAYILRLIDFLASDYEKLQLYLGEDQFDEMARAFIAANPSRTRNARWYGARLPEFLRGHEPYAQTAALCDLAELERALNDVFDARDAPVLEMADLAAVPPENWAGLTFTPHPAVRRADLSTNADDIWRALHSGETPAAPSTPGETRQLIVSRNDGMAMFRPMASDEAMMWDEAATGVRFSVLCEMLAMFAGEDEVAARAAGYLQGWIAAGMLARPGAESRT